MKITKRYGLVLILSMVALAAHAAGAADLDEKMKEIREMFSSPHTEEDYYRADRLLVSATGSLVPVFKAPSVASVITKEDIEAMGATTLDEVLQTVPGLHVLPSGSNIFSSTWSIRGISTALNPQVLLLINGVPLTTTFNGCRPQTFRMPVAMISRVEIVRGPGSALHGADAFAGTVNVITKDGQEVDGTKTGLRYGSFDTVDAWLQHGGNYRGWDVVGSLETQHSQGDDGRIIGQDLLGIGPPSLAPAALDTSYQVTEGQLGLRKDHVSFRFYGSWTSDTAMGPGLFQIVSDQNKSDGYRLIGDLAYNREKVLKDLDLNLRLYSAYLKTNDFFHEILTQYSNPIAVDKYTAFESSLNYQGITAHKVRLAAGLKFFATDTEEYRNYGPGTNNGPGFPIGSPGFGPLLKISSSDIFLDDQSRELWNVSIQDEWSMAPRWQLTAGVRYDDYSDFGSTTNPRAALVWEARYDLTAKLLYGRAFRAPSFSELHFANNSILKGNPDLKPETIDTYELALDYQPTVDFRSILSFFHYDIDGLIEYVPAGLGPLQAENFKNQEGNGFELEMNWEIVKDLVLKGNFSFQRSKDKDTGEVVPDVPATVLYLNPHWAFLPNWSLDGQFFWVADRHRANGDPRSDINDYELVNLTLRRRLIAKNWEAALAARNIFDADIREPSPSPGSIPNDYPMEGRNIWVELRCSF